MKILGIILKLLALFCVFTAVDVGRKKENRLKLFSKLWWWHMILIAVGIFIYGEADKI